MCVYERCPESLWLVDLKYRGGNWRGLCNNTEDKTSGETDIQVNKISTKAPKWPFEEWQKETKNSTPASIQLNNWPYNEWQENTSYFEERQKNKTAQNAKSRPNRGLRSYFPLSISGKSVSKKPVVKIEEPQYTMGLPLIGAMILLISNLSKYIVKFINIYQFHTSISGLP